MQSFCCQLLYFINANQTLAITQVIHRFTVNSIQKSLLNVYIQQLKPKLKQSLKPPQPVLASLISFGTRIAWSTEFLLRRQLLFSVARLVFKRHHFKLHFKEKLWKIAVCILQKAIHIYNLCQSMYFENMAVKGKHTNRNENFINKNIASYLSSPDHHKENEIVMDNKLSRFSCGSIK